MPTVVNSYRSTSAFGGSGTYTITGVTSGNTLLVMFNLSTSNQPIVSITDSQSGTYTEDLTFTGPNGDTFFFYRRSNITNAPTSVTVDWTGNAGMTCNIFEVSGLDNASPVDATATDTSSTFNSSPSKSITTATGSAAVFGYLALSVNQTFTPDSGWSALPTSGSEYDFIVYDNDVGAAGSKTVSGTLGASTNWRWGVIAYKAAATSTAAKPAMHYARLRTA